MKNYLDLSELEQAVLIAELIQRMVNARGRTLEAIGAACGKSADEIWYEMCAKRGIELCTMPGQALPPS